MRKQVLLIITFLSWFNISSQNFTMPDENKLTTALDFVVPVRFFRKFTGDLMSNRDPESRRAEFKAWIDNFWKVELTNKKNIDISDINTLKEAILKFNETNKDSPLIDLRNELLGLLEDKKNIWTMLEVELQQLSEFFEKHKEMIDKSIGLKFSQNYSVGKFTLDDLTHIEKMLTEVNRDIDSTIKRKDFLSSLKIDSEESLKREETTNKKKDLIKNNNEDFKRNFAENENEQVFLDRHFFQQKIDVLKLRIYASTILLNIIDEVLDLLKCKQKELLEPTLKKVKNNLVVNLSDFRKIELKVEHLKTATKNQQENIIKEVLKEKQKQEVLSSKIKDLQQSLKNKRLGLSEPGADSIDLKCNIFFIESSIIKYKYDSDLVDQNKNGYELSKRKIIFSYDIEYFYLLRAKAFYLFSNGNENGLMKLLSEVKDVELPNVNKKYDGIAGIFNNIENFLITVSSKKTELKERKETLNSLKNTLFLGKRSLFQENLDLINDAENMLDKVVKKCNESRLELLDLKKDKEILVESLENLRREVNSMIGFKNLTSRSPGAISYDSIISAWSDFEHFYKIIFWASKDKLNPINIYTSLKTAQTYSFLGFLVFILLFLAFAIIGQYFLQIGKGKVDAIADSYGYDGLLPKRLTFLRFILNILSTRFLMIFGWIYTHIFIRYSNQILGFSFYNVDPYYLSLFYIASTLMFINIAKDALRLLTTTNNSIRSFLFKREYDEKNIFLVSLLLYSSALIIPIWGAITVYSPYLRSSTLGSVLAAAYFLIIPFILAFLFDKEDILAIIPHYGYPTWILRKSIERFYVPLWLFILTICVCFNPYVGYTNLGWWLLFNIPASVVVILIFYFIQTYGKLLVQNLFLNEGNLDGEIIEKFDNARLFYGLYVILSFFLCIIGAYSFLARLWTDEFKLYFLWQNISENWTIGIGEQKKFGLVQLFVFTSVISSGYFLSLFIQKWILNKLFDIFRCEAGIKNTVSRIVLYIVVVISIIIGLVAVDLGNLVQMFTVALLVGVGIGMRDQIADVFAGILILLERQIEEDHFIEFGDIRGSVHKISFRSTTVRTVRNFFVSIPNRLLITKTVINWGAGRVAVGLEFNIKVAFGSDPELVCGIIRQVIYENNQILKVPAAVVRLDEFSEYGMTFFARAFLSARKVRDQWDIAATMRVEIMKKLKEQNIELAYPNIILHSLIKNKEGSSVSIKIDNNDPSDDEYSQKD